MNDKNKKLIVLLLIAVIAVSAVIAAVVLFRSEDKPDSLSVSSLEIKNLPTKRYYLPGEDVLFDGCVITVRYSDGTEKDVNLNENDFSVMTTGTAVDETVGFIKVSTGGQSVNVPYMVSSTYDGVEFDSEDFQSVYTVGNSVLWGSSKFSIKKRNSTSSTVLKVTAAANKTGYNFSVSGFSTEVAGEYKLKVTFLAEIYELDYKVVGYPFVHSIALTGTPRTVYLKGEDVDLGNLQLLTETSLGESATVQVTADMISGFDSSETGTDKKMTLKYTPSLSDCDASFEIAFTYTVYDENQIESVVFSAATGELNYYVGDKINIVESTLKIKFVGGVTAEVGVSDASVRIEESGFDTSKGGRFKLNVFYTTPNGTEYCCETEYIVTARVEKMEVKNVESMKGFTSYSEASGTVTLVYSAGDTFDFGDAYVLMTYDDGSTKELNLQQQLNADTRSVILLTVPDMVRLTPDDIDMNTERENEIYVGWAGGRLLTVNYVIVA